MKSGIRVVRPVSRRDEEDCTSPSEPEIVIAACTRLIESGQFAGHDLALLHYDRGVAHKNNKDFDRAISDYSEAIGLKLNYAHAYLNRGALLTDKREIDRAIADFAAAIRLDPKEKLGYKNRAAIYKIKHDWDRAIADYGEAIRLDPGDIDIIYARGVAYLSKQDCDRAIGDFAEVIRLEPKAAGAFTLQGALPSGKREFRAGCRRFYRGDPADAARPGAVYRPRFGASLRRRSRPRDRRIYRGARDRSEIGARLWDRGWSYRGKGEFDRAVADYDRALQLDPKNAQIFFARGFTSYLAGSPAKALADISQANALDPAAPYAALWLGILGQRSGLPGQMAKATAKIDMTAWPAPVIKLYLGELTIEALRCRRRRSRPEDASEQVCEVNFYTGEIARRGGAKAEATRLFTLAAQECPATWIELEAANAELKALAASR